MKGFKEITHKEWLEQYQIEIDMDGEPKIYETYGEDLEYVNKHVNNVWTLTDGDDGDCFIQSHKHRVNRVAYYVGKVELPDYKELHIQVN